MPVSVSIVEVMTLGALVACLLFLACLLGFGFWVARRLFGFATGFRSFGAERVNGVVQMKGLFNDEASLPPLVTVKKAATASVLRQAFDFEPSPEDIERAERVAATPEERN